MITPVIQHLRKNSRLIKESKVTGKSTYIYPSDEDFIRIYEECKCNLTNMSDAINIPRSTLESHIRISLSLRKLVTEAREKNKTIVPSALKPGDTVSREETLQHENIELRAALKSARSEDVKEQRVIDSIKNALESKQSRYKPRDFVSKKPSKHEFVLQWSDAHAAEIVSAEETNGANEYNWEIMLKRHADIRNGVLSYQENRPYPIEKLHIFGLGDMLSGNIHEELAETNEMPMAEATVQFGLDAADWIESFIPHFKTIRIACVVGNHPREKKKQPSKHRFSNGDWVSYQVMKQRLAKYDCIEFEVPKPQRFPVEVCGKNLLLMHGDGIRSTMVDVPWGGIIRFTNKLQNQYAQMGMPIDHFLLGHYHEANIVRNRRILMNGSIKGLDEYSMDRFGGGSNPEQNLLTFHKNRGLVDVSFVDCD
jgi:hypothetical protein